MSSAKKIILGFISLAGILVFAFLFYMIVIVKASPINSKKENSVEVTGIVDELYEGGVKDLVFKLKGSETIYYINRALENGFNLNEAKKEFLEKEVTLLYAKHVSRPNGGGHMMQLQFQDSIYYTEWEIPLASKN